MDLQTLSDAFRKYAVHTPLCDRLKRNPDNCECGFTQILICLPINTNVPCANDFKEEPYKVEVGDSIKLIELENHDGGSPKIEA